MLSLLAQKINNPIAPNLSPGTPAEAANLFEKIIQTLVSWFLIIASLLFFFYFIIGAIKWIASGGDKNAVEGARQTITHALVGIVIVFATFAIIKIIEAAFGVCILTFSLPGLGAMGGGNSCFNTFPIFAPGQPF